MATSPKKPKAEFTKAETRKFIQLYTSHDVLWNASNQHYTKKDKRAQALQEIATFFPEKALTNEEICAKIASLRTSYARELKKVTASKKSDDGVYRSRWEFFPLLDPFLYPHMRQRGSIDNTDSPREEAQRREFIPRFIPSMIPEIHGTEVVSNMIPEIHQNETTENEVEQETSEGNRTEENLDDEVTATSVANDTTTNITNDTFEALRSSSTSKSRSYQSNSQDNFQEAVVSALSRIGNGKQSETNPHLQFCRHLAEEMCHVTDRNLLRRLKTELQNMVFEYQIKQEEQNGDQNS